MSVRRTHSLIAVGALAVLLAACVVEPLQVDADRDPAVRAALNESLSEAAANAERTLDYGTAADHYARLYDRDPDRLDALVGQARNLRYDGRTREAIRLLRGGLDSHGDEPALLLELAKCQFAAGLTNDSRETIERLHAAAPEGWQGLTLLAMLRDRQGDYDGARELYVRALDLSPGNPTVVNNYSLSLAQAGRLDEAIETLERLALGERSTFQARQNLVMLYVIRGDMDKAEKLGRDDLPPDKVRQNLTAYQALVE